MCRLIRVAGGGGSLLESADCWLLIETPLVEARGVAGPSDRHEGSGEGIWTGKGNSDLRFLLRRGSLKNVVCACTDVQNVEAHDLSIWMLHRNPMEDRQTNGLKRMKACRITTGRQAITDLGMRLCTRHLAGQEYMSQRLV